MGIMAGRRAAAKRKEGKAPKAEKAAEKVAEKVAADPQGAMKAHSKSKKG